MIIVHGKFPLKPECREEAIELVVDMAELTREEPGCLSYDFYESLSDPNKLLLFQEWESWEALEDHFKTRHMVEFVQSLPKVLAGQITMMRYAIQAPASAHEDEAENELELEFDEVLDEEFEEELVDNNQSANHPTESALTMPGNKTIH